jgi:tRNA A-37 threonylcarbamoyl transferase component Bud32
VTREPSALSQPFGRAPTLESRGRARRRTGVFAVVALAVLAGVAAWTYSAVRESLTDLLGGQLQTILDANTKALGLWAAGEKQHVQEWAEAPQVRQWIHALVRQSRSQGDVRETLLASPDSKKLKALLAKATSRGDLRGFLAFDSNGVVLVSGHDPIVGKRLSAPSMSMLAPALTGDVVLSKPFQGLAVLPDIRLPKPLMFAAAPVREAGERVVAVLVLRVDPVEDFSRVLSAGRPGNTGQTYAFDQSGLMISTSRFEDQLKRIELLPPDEDVSSILRVPVRDPGGDLTAGYEPDTAIAERPLTRMAASAVAGGSGIDLDGYRDFRGVKVIGAWRWLADLELGLATEMELGEAFRLLRPLGLAYAGLLALLIAAAVAIIVYTYRVRRLRRRVTEAEQMGQYTLGERIGEGGMAVVYMGRHAMLRRPTAVKVLKPEVANEETLVRFEREVQLTSQLTHPNTVEIYDYGHTPRGLFYYAMEYLQGVSLADLIVDHGAVAPARTAYILRQVCGSLHEAHDVGLIHRDIKPPNIMLCRRGGRGDVVKVLDFGLVKEIKRDADVSLTAANVVAGTPQYIAPERFRDPDAVDARSDLYSLGAVAFNLLTGEDVFPGKTSMEICHHVLHSEPRPPSALAGDAIPEALDRLVLDCLAKDPAMRPQTATELVDRLDAIEACGSWSEREAWKWWEAHPDLVPAMPG